MESLKLEKAIEQIKKLPKERKFDQTVELIVNLKKFDVKKNQINTFVSLPHKMKDKKVCGFIEDKSDLVDVISKKNFIAYKDKKKLKQLIKKYDFFIASGANMPAVATTFGRVLGPAGKMPSPKLGILMQESPEAIKEVVGRINKAVRIQAKEPSIKIAVAKQKMTDVEIADNVKAGYNAILNELPMKKDNVKSVMIKLTMGAPVRVESL